MKALYALRSTLNDEYLSRVANLDSAFVVWNTLISLGEQKQYYMGSDSDDRSDASNIFYMCFPLILQKGKTYKKKGRGAKLQVF